MRWRDFTTAVRDIFMNGFRQYVPPPDPHVAGQDSKPWPVDRDGRVYPDKGRKVVLRPRPKETKR